LNLLTEVILMQNVINAKTLRTDLAAILERVRKGERFTVVYRNRPVCRLVPVDVSEEIQGALEEDPLYRAVALGRSSDSLTATDHDALLYGSRRR
jgi:prevent-host-death family protein